MTQFHIQFQITEDSYFKTLSFAKTKNYLGLKKSKLVYWVFSFLTSLIIFSGIVLYLEQLFFRVVLKEDFPILVNEFGLGLCVLLLISTYYIIFYNKLLAKLTFDKFFRDKSVRFEFFEDYFISKSNFFESKIEYSAIIDFQKYKDQYQIVLSTNQILAIPVSSFKDFNEADFASFVEGKINKLDQNF